MMNYSQLGKSDLEISEISFGCMSLEEDQEKATKLLREAYEKGINFFDTADLYDKGLNEIMVGKALRSVREKVLIGTKVGNVWRDDGSGWDWNPSKEHILTAVNESLNRLGTDYIDLYQLHGGTLEDPIDDIIEAFEQLRKQGKIRAYGISSIRPNVIRQYMHRSNMDCVMMQYSLLDRRPEEFCLNALSEQNISVITRGSLAKGMLIDKPAKEYLGYSKEEVQKMKSAVADTGNTVSASLQYVLKHPAVASSAVGIRTVSQLQDAAGALETSISKEKLEKLGRVLKSNTYQQHR